MSDPEKNATDPELRARLDSLSSALRQTAKAEEAEAKASGDDKALSGALSSGLRAAADLTGGVIAGALIGYLGDRWLGTSPFLLIAFLAIGTIAGFRSVYRLGARPTVERTRQAPKD
jgi:ATP synthase protein I